MGAHTQNAEQLFSEWQSSRQGLSLQQVAEKQERFGKNVLEEKKKKAPWKLFLHQFTDFMILVLIAAAIISGVAGDRTDMIIILVIVLLNAIVGFVQEYKAEKAMEALKKMATPSATVIREGKTLVVGSEELVPGDIVQLEAGGAVPADLRLLEAFSLRLEESSLTGESVPVDKTAEVLTDKDVPLGEMTNMAFKGTQVINGRAVGIAVGTGMHTELGKIAKMLQDEGTITPLQKRMMDFGKKLSWIILAICAVLFVTGLLRGEDTMEMLLLAISLAVAAIPEALPALITVALALGAKRMVKKNALIRKLPAVETLGSVTYICSDKTGTLTKNKMTVVKVVPAETDLVLQDDLSLLESAMLLNHDVKLDGEEMAGDPTEIAMVDHFQDPALATDLAGRFPRVDELPFDAARKCMTTIHKMDGKYIAISKGAAESITAILNEGRENAGILDDASRMAAEGVRVLAFSYREFNQLPEKISIETVEADMQFAGLVGMIDPPREEIYEAISQCRTAGIRPVMITGDHKETAAAIARDIGILRAKDLVVTGRELAEYSAEAFEEDVESISVYARVSPQQKLDIVKALQKKSQFVAMTGDGVNDAPSLKSADIGIAMGITGTDVSKESAHMILLDDNFATIVKAIREGRRIYDNIRKFVKYIMTCNSAEIWTIFLAPLIGLPIPLLPIHILWINLVTDGLPGLALSTEKAEPDIMKRKPRRTNESLFSDGIGIHIIWVGLLMAFITLGVQAWAIHTDNPNWQTMVFTVLSLSQLGHVMAIRGDEFIYKKGLLGNKPLIGAVLFTFLLQLVIIYTPFANEVLKTSPLSLEDLIICIVLSAVVFHAVEAEKWVRKRWGKKK